MSAHHRHQTSLERTLDFSIPPPYEHELYLRATAIFQTLINTLEPRETTYLQYKRITLLRGIHEMVQAKEDFLTYLFLFIEKDGFGIAEDIDLDFSLALTRYNDLASWDATRQQKLETSLANFADHMINAFFLPMKALGSTPIISPSTPTMDNLQSNPSVNQRDPVLRRSCLRRDGHRCVVSQSFDAQIGWKRLKEEGENARDDDGRELPLRLRLLQVCHIIPHSLTSQHGRDTSQQGREALESKDRKIQVAIRILNMFDPDVSRLLDGPEIDRPYNAITLTTDLHWFFGGFLFYFEPTSESHTYVIKAWGNSGRAIDFPLPITRTLRLDVHRAIDPPSPRLLAIHRAVGHILHLSAAGQYIDAILRSLEDVRTPMEDGSTDLSSYINTRLGGWSEVSAR